MHTVYPDTNAGVWHLGLPEGNHAGSYCTTFNPVWGCNLSGAHLRTTTGGTAVISDRGATVGQLVRDLFAPWEFKGTPLEVCPACLTLARAEAELVSQRKYNVRALLRQFEAPEVPPA
ncbi:hypothetical protein CYJ48_11075 [Corynebacterium riegelii]|nr:hypothetical protein CYJ48_11075 [Corynebacterium riegelii]